MSRLSLPPLCERVFFITGATAGIGEFTAELLAKEKCTVLVHGRSPEKVEKVLNFLRRHSPNVHGFVADLSLMSEVRRLGKEVSSQFPVIHGLLNNAGTFAGDYTGKRKVTAEGSNDALSDLQCERNWSDHRAYELSKLCDAMMATELHDRYGDPPRLCVHTMDPGTVDTKMLRAGWGRGASVRTATTSFEMLTQDRFQEQSGIGSNYCCGEGKAARRKLWEDLEQLTGAEYT